MYLLRLMSNFNPMCFKRIKSGVKGHNMEEICVAKLVLCYTCIYVMNK